MGGDEFLIIFPDARQKKIETLISRIHKGLREEKIQDIPIDFSYGFMEFEPDTETDIQELIRKADTKMYQSKLKKKKKQGKLPLDDA